MNNIPVLVLEGDENALSLAHSFHRRNVPVTVITAGENSVLRSRLPFRRYARPGGMAPNDHFEQVLLDNPPADLEGAVVFACSDSAIEFICSQRDALAARYRLDTQDRELQPMLLDKRTTLELAARAGVPAPAYRRIVTPGDLEAILSGEIPIQFPVLLKPTYTLRFRAQFACKLFVINNRDELATKGRDALEGGHELILTELIPGPDTLLSSYYTHLDAEGRPLFHFTKRIIRRSPVNFGAGAYHETKWLPRTAEAGLRFFEGVGLKGLGNVEFKLDERDGQLKLIECNARITAANEIAVAAGLDIAGLIYDRLLGREPPPPAMEPAYREGVTLWYPEIDVTAFRELRARGELTLAGWLKSLARPQHFPLLRMNDPIPSLHALFTSVRERIKRRFSRASTC